MPTVAELREQMVVVQIERRGIRDPRVLAAMRNVPRHHFVPEVSISEAYADHPLPIGQSQTISQPYMVALMTELLAPQAHHHLMEVGAGSGYQTAILAKLCRHVTAIERIPELSARGQEALRSLGVSNVTWITGDGTLGYPAGAPFNGILVAAGSPEIPAPLMEQLSEDGRLVVPIGRRHFQELRVVQNRPGQPPEIRHDTACRFVDLIGRHGWPEE